AMAAFCALLVALLYGRDFMHLSGNGISTNVESGSGEDLTPAQVHELVRNLYDPDSGVQAASAQRLLSRQQSLDNATRADLFKTLAACEHEKRHYDKAIAAAEQGWRVCAQTSLPAFNVLVRVKYESHRAKKEDEKASQTLVLAIGDLEKQ